MVIVGTIRTARYRERQRRIKPTSSDEQTHAAAPELGDGDDGEDGDDDNDDGSSRSSSGICKKCWKPGRTRNGRKTHRPTGWLSGK